MTVEEVKKAVDEMKATGHDEEDILAALYIMFQNDEVDLETLEAIVHVMGYELTDEFKAMSPEDQKSKGYEMEEESEETEGKSEEEKFPEEKPEEKEEPEVKEEVDEEVEEKEEKPDGEESEEDEEKRAMKLFGLDK